MANINLPFEGEVTAHNKAAIKVINKASTGYGILGETAGGNDTAGVVGFNNNWVGVWGRSIKHVGVLGEGPIAGRFVGDVEVTGDIKLLNADCA
jgi:hypothetical protein